MSAGVTVPIEAIVTLRRRLAALPARHPERQPLMASTAELYDISRATLYRLLRGERRPKDAHRADRGLSRTMPAGEIDWWCEVVAAMKSRTTNRQGRRLSTKRILEIVTEYGVETPDRGLVKLPPGRLAASTLNRHMRQRGYDTERMTREPAAVRYQAERANMLWHFDMSPSDLKQLKAPTWIDPDRNGAPTLMLFSVVDDRSGVVYQEYALVYGEDAEAALRFLFRAMAPKEDNPFEGIPENMQLDGGPVGKSIVFKRVMECLGITVTPHMPAGRTDAAQPRAPRARSSDRFAPSRKRTRRCTTSTSRPVRRRPIAGWRATSPPTIAAIIVATGGITGGYTNSVLKFPGVAESVEYDVLNIGLYAGYNSGSFFLNALGKYDRARIGISAGNVGLQARTNGNTYGAKGEAGFRLGGSGFYAEPNVSLAYIRTDLDTIRPLGVTIDFDNMEGLRGTAGLRIGSTMGIGGNSVAVFYAGGDYVHEFHGEQGFTFSSGSNALAFRNVPLEDYGRGKLGMSITSGIVTGFIEGNGIYSKNYSGGGGRAGLRIAF